MERTDRARKVDVIGFNPTERIVLASIFNLSQRRKPRYEERASGLDELADVLLVDAADAACVEQAKMIVAARATPVILVGDRDHGTSWPVVPRPLQWARLFRALDLAIGAPGFGGAGTLAPEKVPTPAMPLSVMRVAPAAADSAPAPEPEPPQIVIKVIPGAPWVLVVDDSEAVREQMRRTLAPLALNIDVAESGEKAIGMTAGRNYACIFLDVMLPGVDGYQVCKLIKSKPTGHRAPVIMLTSRSSPFDRIRGSMAGCDSYLAKPVDEARLRSTVVKLLRQEKAAAVAGRA
jgi:twitching motility two-component system response regulator PilG